MFQLINRFTPGALHQKKKLLEDSDTSCAASQLEKRLRLIRRTITLPLVAERSLLISASSLPPLHTFLHPGRENLQLVCAYTHSQR